MLPLLARPVRKQVWQISTLNCFRLRYLERSRGHREALEVIKNTCLKPKKRSVGGDRGGLCCSNTPVNPQC